jgi:Xaa-Pro aminopeptidase
MFGIRIENMVIVKKHPSLPNKLCFENITMCPYNRELLDFALLSKDSIAYINAYHKKVKFGLIFLIISRFLKP